MREGFRYSLTEPPLQTDLTPGENYVEEFDRWSMFKSAVESIAYSRGIQLGDVMSNELFYKEAISFLEQENDGNGEDGSGIRI